MAITILPEKPGIGERFGTGLGTGLSQGLQLLAQQKMGQLAQRQQDQRTTQGVKLIQQGDFAGGFALLPESVKPEAYKGQRGAGQAANFEQMLTQMLGGGQEQQPGLGGAQQPKFQDTLGGSALNQRQIEKLADVSMEIQKEDRKDKKDRWKHNKKFLAKVDSQSEVAARALPRYAAQRALVKRGNLPNPTFYNLTKKLGGETFAQLFNPEAEQYGKIVQDFVKNIKDVFGARITEKQIEQYLKSLPTLANTDEGKLRILDFLELTNKAELARGESINDLIHGEGGDGAPPYNIRALAAKKTTAIYEDLGDQLVALIESGGQPEQRSLVGQKVPVTQSVPDGTTGLINGVKVIRRNQKWVKDIG